MHDPTVHPFFQNVGDPVEVGEFGNGWAPMIQRVRFYADETGTHGGSVCGVAGYLATAENWEHFRQEWEDALHAPKAVDYFKRGANYHGDPPFDGWTEHEREKKLYRMVSVFARYRAAIYELSSTIGWGEYNSVVVGALKEEYPHPYFFCFHGVVSLAVDVMREAAIKNPGVEPIIDFVFDQQREFAKEAHGQYVTIYHKYPELAKYMGGCVFKDDKRTAGLQAADLIAWQLHRDLVRPPEDEGRQRPELCMLRNMYDYCPKWRRWNPSGLAQFVASHDPQA
jgi:hypothetical protein